MYRRTNVCLIGLAACVVLAAVVGILAFSGTSLAGKPEKKITYNVARISFTESSRIQWDGVASCTDPAGGADIHYWDQHDTAVTGGEPDANGIETSVSGGGRLFFFTLAGVGRLPVQPDRWLVLDLTPPGGIDDGKGPNIDKNVYSPEDRPWTPSINPNTYIDNVKCCISLDVMFKKNATRQPLILSVRKATPEGYWAPAGWTLRSVDDLYIVETGDKKVRLLTTANPDTNESDADLFELRKANEAGEMVTVGTYRIPLTWTIRLVEEP